MEPIWDGRSAGKQAGVARKQVITDTTSDCENTDLPDREEKHDITVHCKVNGDLSD